MVYFPSNVDVFSGNPGASEVKSAYKATVSNSTTRVDIVAPTLGKKIRIISVIVVNASAIGTRFEVYFSDGANITSNAGKEISEFLLDIDFAPTHSMVWPDGGGPVGVTDDVVSLRTISDIGGNGSAIIYYREE